jgi:C-terminal processing protease CtpA/Prc
LFGQVPPAVSSPRLDKEFVRTTIEALTKIIREQYIDQDLASRVEAYLRNCLATGHYDQPTREEFAEELTRDLFTSSHDKHLSVMVSDDQGTASSGTTEESREEIARQSNFGIQHVEVLPGNVGYLRLTSFYRPAEARDTFVSAMKLLAQTDALILDLRGNKGGSPDMAVLVASFMFSKPGIPLFSVIPRAGETAFYSTVQTPPPGSSGERPLFVLTSQTTWSAGEGLAFILQERHRAEIIGETTAGAANPGRAYRVNSMFEVNVPNGRVKSAVLGRNWEGIGVVPDVATPAAVALDLAHTHALRSLVEITPPGQRRTDLERELQVPHDK